MAIRRNARSLLVSVSRSRSSRKDRAIQARELGKALVEGHQLESCRASESSQVSVAPEIRRKSRPPGECPPVDFDRVRLANESDTWIAQDPVVQVPCLTQGYRILVEDLGVGCESEEPLLRQPAKAELPGRQAVEPTLGVKVVEMDVERQGQPQIDVRQEHRPLPGTPRCAGRSNADSRGAWTGREGTRSVAHRPALSRV